MVGLQGKPTFAPSFIIVESPDLGTDNAILECSYTTTVD